MKNLLISKLFSYEIVDFTLLRQSNTYRLGVKRAVSTQVQPNPCGISKSNKINTFEPFIST